MKKIVVFIFVIIVMTTNVQAEDILNEQMEIIQSEEIENSLPSDSKYYMRDISIEDMGLDFGAEIVNMITDILSSPQKIIENVMSPIIKILIIIVICGLGTGISGTENKLTEKIINITGTLAITGVMLSDINGMFADITAAITNLDIFSKALLPTMAGVLTLTGAPITGATSYAATVFAFDILITFVNRVLIPIVYAYIAMISINAALSNDALKRLCDFFKWGTTTLLKFFLTIFISYISVSSVITSNVGSMAVKTTKFAVSGALPIVGGIISDATETFLSSAVVLKNSVGIFGMIAVISICFLPLIQIGLNFLVFKISAALITPIATPSLSGLLDGLSGSFSMLFGMLGTCATVLFAEIVIIILLVRPL